MLNLIGAVLIFIGSLVCVFAAVGLYRLPGIFAKMHAATKTATLACGLVLFGVAINLDKLHTYTEVLILIILIAVTNPISAHYIAKTFLASDQNKGDL